MDINNLEKLCRICIKESPDCVSLHNNKFPKSDTLLIDFLRKVADLEIRENDGLPSILCVNCFEQLAKFFELVELSVSSDLTLKNLVYNIETAEDNKSEIFEIKCDNSETKASEKQFYNCNLCSKSFSKKIWYSKHRKTHGSSPYKCQECNLSFLNKRHLSAHLSSLHNKNAEKNFSCGICQKQFAYKHLLRQHEFKHSDNKPFPCTVCDKGCLTAESLKRHMTIHDKNYVKKRHSCTICGKEFAYPSFLAEHMKNHTGEKPYLCSTCGKGFRQSGALHYHQRLHTGYKPFTCSICNGSFMSQSVLKVHMRKHTNERPYVCHICGIAFRQSTDLKTHQRTHTGDRPALCTICGKRLSTTGQLTIHIRSHTGEKPFSCSSCSKSFTTKTMLVKHERVHTGERPYICDVCGRTFSQSSTLRSHKNTHLNEKKRSKKETAKEKPLEGDCIFYKSDMINLETEIVSNEFIGERLQDLQILRNEEGGKTQYTVILPTPIPLVHNL